MASVPAQRRPRRSHLPSLKTVAGTVRLGLGERHAVLHAGADCPQLALHSGNKAALLTRDEKARQFRHGPGLVGAFRRIAGTDGRRENVDEIKLLILCRPIRPLSQEKACRNGAAHIVPIGSERARVDIRATSPPRRYCRRSAALLRSRRAREHEGAPAAERKDGPMTPMAPSGLAS